MTTKKSNCQKCGQTFEFDFSEFQESGQTATHIFGQAIDCPSCGNKTIIAVEKPALKASDRNIDYSQLPVYEPEYSERDKQLILSYTLAVLIPLAGFFTGVYLMAKKEHGHGATCMGVSVFCSLVWL